MAVVMMCVSMASTTAAEACVKLLSARLPIGETLAVRGTIICALLVPMVVSSGDYRSLKNVFQPLVLSRTLVDSLCSLFYFIALAHISLPRGSALFMTAPLMMTLSSALIYRESVGWRRWCTMCVGFGGVLLVLHPTGEASSNAAALLVLLSAACVVARDLLTRHLSQETSSLAILLSSTLGATLLGFALALRENWLSPTMREVLLLTAAAVAAGIANLAAIYAFRRGQLRLVAPFRYTSVAWSGVFGWLIWGYVMDAMGLVGVALIVLSGLYTLHRERVRGQQSATEVAAQG